MHSKSEKRALRAAYERAKAKPKRDWWAFGEALLWATVAAAKARNDWLNQLRDEAAAIGAANAHDPDHTHYAWEKPTDRPRPRPLPRPLTKLERPGPGKPVKRFALRPVKVPVPVPVIRHEPEKPEYKARPVFRQRVLPDLQWDNLDKVEARRQAILAEYARQRAESALTQLLREVAEELGTFTRWRI